MAFSGTLPNLGDVPEGPPPGPDELPPGLREEYLAGMRATLGVLAGIAKRLAATGSDREALETLRGETHKIHGSAGSFGFMEASRLAAGMEATAKDWIARPGDTDMDRGGLAGWFVTRLAEMLNLAVPAAAAPPPAATTSPPRLIIRRPSAAQRALAPPPTPPPLRPPPRPEPPKQTPPKVRPSRPLTPFKKPSVAPATPAPPPGASAPPAPPPPRRETPPERAPQPPPSPPQPPPRPPPPPPKRPPKPPPAQPEGIPWLVTPEESVPAKQPQAPAPPRAPASPPPAPPPAAATSAAPELILVEDDPALAELLEYGLRSRGYRFVSYRNGRDALRELLALDVAGTRPLVLLDVDLPGLDGYSVLEGLERDRPGAYRVVFTTVHGGEAEQLRGLEAGALDYLVKPISLRVALEKIRRWVGR